MAAVSVAGAEGFSRCARLAGGFATVPGAISLVPAVVPGALVVAAGGIVVVPGAIAVAVGGFAVVPGAVVVRAMA